MNSVIEVQKLSEQNFSDYERLTKCADDGGCYCAFWHQKWNSMEAWHKREKEAPELNRATVLDRVRSGFHVGILAYKNSSLLAWVSVGPLIDFYWTWKRAIQVGPNAKNIAGITCMTMTLEYRGKGLQRELLQAVINYSKTMGWSSLEGYPFDQSEGKKLDKSLYWPGLTKCFIETGFQRVEPHWLSQPNYERSIYSMNLS